MRRRQCCTGTIRLDRGCSPGGPWSGIPVAIHDVGDPSPLDSGTTDSAGIVRLDVPVGIYELRVRPGASNEIRKPVAIACGATAIVAVYDRLIQFFVKCCTATPVVGATIAITGPESVNLTTGADGKASWHPETAGSYSYSVTHPSARLVAASGSYSIPSLCAAYGTIEVAMGTPEGFSCCNLSMFYDGAQFKFPRGPIKVTTSAGATWWLAECATKKCTISDEVLTGPAYPDPYEPLPILFDGQVVVQVEVRQGPVYWEAKVASAWASHPSGHQWFPPLADCSDSASYAPYVYVNGVVDSIDPLSVTFEFPDPSGASYSWTPPASMPPMPTPLKWITLTEILP